MSPSVKTKYPRCPAAGNGGIFELGFLPPAWPGCSVRSWPGRAPQRSCCRSGVTSERGCGVDPLQPWPLGCRWPVAFAGRAHPAHLPTQPCSESPGDPPPGPALPAAKPARERGAVWARRARTVPEGECLRFQPGSSSPEMFCFRSGGLIRVVHGHLGARSRSCARSPARVTLASCPVRCVRSPRVPLARSPAVRQERCLQRQAARRESRCLRVGRGAAPWLRGWLSAPLGWQSSSKRWHARASVFCQSSCQVCPVSKGLWAKGGRKREAGSGCRPGDFSSWTWFGTQRGGALSSSL